MRYFYIRGQNLQKAGVVTIDEEVDEYEYWDDLESRRDTQNWKVISASLQPFQNGGNEAVDFPPSNLLNRLCSAKLRRIIETFTTDAVWLPVKVEGQGDYFILHFSEFPDLLDHKKTEFIAGRVFKAHLDIKKVQTRHVFALDPLASSVIVSETVRDFIVEDRCTGLQFEKVPIS